MCTTAFTLVSPVFSLNCLSDSQFSSPTRVRRFFKPHRSPRPDPHFLSFRKDTLQSCHKSNSKNPSGTEALAIPVQASAPLISNPTPLGRIKSAVTSKHFCYTAAQVAVAVAVGVVIRTVPVLAAATTGVTIGPATTSGPLASLRNLAETSSFISGLTAAFLLVLASEIGDKTFFISALLSMKYSRLLVLIGTMLALASMTVISVVIGQIFHALPTSLNASIPFDDYAAVALLLWFGFQNIRDGLSMKEDDNEELQDAKDVVEEKSSGEDSPNSSTGVRVVAETSSLIFLAEWGDKSMLATVALAAAKSPLGVIVGGISGHFVASVIAVVGGSFLGKFISERNARLIGGVLFLVFAVLTIIGIY